MIDLHGRYLPWVGDGAGSLDQALSILDEIRDHRMVGLVSHVAEMRTRIPSRVEVIKTHAGSSLALSGDRE